MKKLFLFLLPLLPSMALAQLSGKEIVKKADDLLQGDSNASTMEMQVVRPKYTRTVSFKSWSLGREYSLTYITAPAKDKGQVFLKRGTEMWNFVPSINRLIKIPPSMMSQGWMGSDYSNDDLVKQTSMVNDYQHQVMGEESIDGRSCYQIKLTPHEESDVVWGKVLLWIDQERFVIPKAQYYDEENYLVRTEISSNLKPFDGRQLLTKIEITPAEEEGNKTIITIKNIEFDIEVDESFFSQQQMKRVK